MISGVQRRIPPGGSLAQLKFYNAEADSFITVRRATLAFAELRLRSKDIIFYRTLFRKRMKIDSTIHMQYLIKSALLCVLRLGNSGLDMYAEQTNR